MAVDSLGYRCREIGTVSDPSCRRAYQRLNQLRKLGLFQYEPVDGYPSEIPVLIRRAVLAEDNGLTMTASPAAAAFGRRSGCRSAAISPGLALVPDTRRRRVVTPSAFAERGRTVASGPRSLP